MLEIAERWARRNLPRLTQDSIENTKENILRTLREGKVPRKGPSTHIDLQRGEQQRHSSTGPQPQREKTPETRQTNEIIQQETRPSTTTFIQRKRVTKTHHIQPHTDSDQDQTPPVPKERREPRQRQGGMTDTHTQSNMDRPTTRKN